MIPGPSVLFLIGRALALGRGPAIASVVGNGFGVYAVAVFVAFGLGSLVQRSEFALVAVKVVGAAISSGSAYRRSVIAATRHDTWYNC